MSNHQTTKLPNHQTILAHAEARRRGGEEDFGTKGRKVEGAMSNHQTTKLPNHQTILAHAEARRGGGAEMDFCTKGQKGEKVQRMEAGMNDPTIQRSNGPAIQRNGQTVKRSNGQTILRLMGRWGAVAAGAWVDGAREAEVA